MDHLSDRLIVAQSFETVTKVMHIFVAPPRATDLRAKCDVYLYCVAAVLALRGLAIEFGMPQDEPSNIDCDKNSVVLVSRAQLHHSNLRFIWLDVQSLFKSLRRKVIHACKTFTLL